MSLPKNLLVIFVIFCAFILVIPNFMQNSNEYSYLPDNKIQLGLDLQGGSQLLLEVDFDYYLKEQLENVEDEIRNILTENKIGYRNLKVHSISPGSDSDINNPYENFYVAFDARDINKIRQIEAILKDNLTSNFLISNDSQQFRVAFTEAEIVSMRQNTIKQAREIVRRRVDETGTTEPIIQQQGQNRILLQVPGIDNPEQLKELLGKTAKLTFHMVKGQQASWRPSTDPTSIILPLEDERNNNDSGDNNEAERDYYNTTYYEVEKTALLTGDMLTDAGVSYDAGSPVVNFSFNSQGARKFGKVTSENVGRQFAIVLDNKIISAPVIRDAIIGGRGIITGRFTVQTANNLSILLRAGALPAPINIVEERTVGPSLGADSIAAGKKAAIIAIILVLVFMLFSYGSFGVIANLSLICNLALLMALLSLLEATLTLPGIAGIILTIGMAVDANVLIFERIKEEYRATKRKLQNKKANNKAAMSKLLENIQNGYHNATSAIIDANITTLLVAIILFSLGSGSIRGFAVTLSLGIFTSIFCAMIVSQVLVGNWVRLRKLKDLPY